MHQYFNLKIKFRQLHKQKFKIEPKGEDEDVIRISGSTFENEKDELLHIILFFKSNPRIFAKTVFEQFGNETKKFDYIIESVFDSFYFFPVEDKFIAQQRNLCVFISSILVQELKKSRTFQQVHSHSKLTELIFDNLVRRPPALRFYYQLIRRLLSVFDIRPGGKARVKSTQRLNHDSNN